MARLDTHRLIKNFVASGTTKKQAEIFIDAATIIAKDEIDFLKKDYSNLATENSLSEIKSNLKKDISDIKSDVAELKTSMNWLKSISIGTFLMLLGSIVTILFKHL
jgi:DNA-binding transcriptional regulator GbsR (MarR family)